MKDKNTHIIIFKDPNPYDELSYGWFLISPHRPEPLEYFADIRVPSEMPYLIVTQSMLPINFWQEKEIYTIDFSNPDGFGSGSFGYSNGDVQYRVEATFTGSYKDWKEIKNV